MKSDIVYAGTKAAILRTFWSFDKFFNKTDRLVIEKRVPGRQTKKRTTACFDNRESKVQTEQFNKEDCQEYQQKCIKVSSITVWRYT